jgi:hypothetical protein
MTDVLSGGGEMGRLMRALDWATTPIGPAEGWSQSLRTAVRICLTSRFPMLIWWGPDLVMLYNDAYCPILFEHELVRVHWANTGRRSGLRLDCRRPPRRPRGL